MVSGLPALFLAGCLTLPGQMATPPFASRVVDREYPVVWETLQATLRNEGATGIAADRALGAIETASRLRPGTKVLAHTIVGDQQTRDAYQVQVRYSVRARALGPDKTEVRLRTRIEYLDRSTGGWVPTTDDGSIAESFWRRFQQDLAYYGVQPEKWRPDVVPGDTPPAGPGPAAGGAAPRAEGR